MKAMLSLSVLSLQVSLPGSYYDWINASLLSYPNWCAIRSHKPMSIFQNAHLSHFKNATTVILKTPSRYDDGRLSKGWFFRLYFFQGLTFGQILKVLNKKSNFKGIRNYLRNLRFFSTISLFKWSLSTNVLDKVSP